jgi:IS4 transposase
MVVSEGHDVGHERGAAQSTRVGGRLWWTLLPLLAAFAAESMGLVGVSARIR